MLIANPIYDVVFQYLMEDLVIAKYLIGHIIDEEIIDLQPSPTVTPYKVASSLHIYRLDYAATIKTKTDNIYKVIIEIQKSLVIEDILRFRHYLAKQYSSHFIKQPKDKRATKTEKFLKAKKMTLPIISIYFLGDKLDTMTQPVIKVKRHYYDAATNQRINGTENFIEQLTHDCYIIQIPYLPKKKRTELERILIVFDQHYINNPQRPHKLNIPYKATMNILYRMIRRLEKAYVNQQIEELMQLEDDHHDIEKKMQLQKEEIAKVKKYAEKEKERATKERKRAEKERKRATKEKVEKEKLIEILQKAGIDYKNTGK